MIIIFSSHYILFKVFLPVVSLYQLCVNFLGAVTLSLCCKRQDSRKLNFVFAPILHIPGLGAANIKDQLGLVCKNARIR